jgi:Protein of unknown function (DUF3024)
MTRNTVVTADPNFKLWDMAFNDTEIARYADLIEKLIWSKRRPPLHLRDKVREGQRIEGHEIELFLVRPLFFDPSRRIESSIAKTRYIKSRDVWQVFWKRADGKWHWYPPRPEVKSFEGFLKLVNEDENGCFWG